MSRPFRIYVYSVSALFWAVFAVGLATNMWTGIDQPARLAPLFGLAVAVEAMGVRKQENTIGFSAVAHLATVVLFGPLVGAGVAALAVVLVDGLRSGPRIYVLMNSTMFGAAAGIAGALFELTGGSVGSVTASDAFPLAVLVVSRLLVNEVLFSGALSMLDASFSHVLRDNLRDSFGQSIGEGCLGVVLAFGYTGQRWVILPFLVPLLAALYQAQASYERLKIETEAALNAFAAVIDERDLNTKKHSERVSEYVARFTHALGLPDREARRLIDAARFHDLGKVAVDVATLSREGRLQEHELRAIRSHPRLSARLLEPFHFAEQMALYAELHHERYDGRGYYAVSQREIPVEAHVLIVADSYDAMISKRAYRPALTEQEAVQELRDKAGSQFHPLVAHAFAAMIEGTSLETAVGTQQLGVLRAEFSRIRTVRWPALVRALAPGHLTFTLSAATALVAVGLPGVPPQIAAGLGTAACLTAAARLIASVRGRRRTQAALSVIESGGSATAALQAAHVDGTAVWLELRPGSFDYTVVSDAGISLNADTATEVSRRALRRGEPGLRGVLSDGSRIEITPPLQPDTHRLAVICDRKLSQFELELLTTVAERCRRAGESTEAIDSRPLDARTGAADLAPATLVVDLGAFEDVRLAAGQLSAERVAADAWARLQALLRQSDQLVRLGEDRFGVILHTDDEVQLESVGRRIADTLAEVPVPRRASRIQPTLRYLSQTELESEPALSRLVRRFDTSSTPGKAA
ncbi:MAG TPA: HD domain-containing phosphohydrolase [Gaiellales bacterium]|nr:HD domain-containing phosphohydrolase [Gaiellales bacterium]